MYLFNRLSLIVGLLLFLSCSRPLPTLENINLDEWREDRNGCFNNRAPMAASMKDQKEKLLGLNEKQLVKLLGRPDQNELYKRNQKFYTYYLTPGPECGTTITSSQILVVRFNAMGLANEVTLQ
jgi:hypothetical protein